MQIYVFEDHIFILVATQKILCDYHVIVTLFKENKEYSLNSKFQSI